MKSMFKKTLHVLLALAITVTFTLSVNAHEDCSFCEHAITETIQTSVEYVVSPLWSICDTFGHSYSFTSNPFTIGISFDEVASSAEELEQLEENYCSLIGTETYDYCDRCYQSYNRQITVNYDESTSHDYVYDITELSDGGFRETRSCSSCGYVSTYERIYYLNK